MVTQTNEATRRNLRTVEAYESYARTYARRVDEEPSGSGEQAMRALLAAVPAGGLVLEVGSGPGYDADFLESLGLQVRRTDATQEFCAIQAERGREAELLNVVTDDLGGPFDAVQALAVLIHVDPAQLGDVLDRIRTALTPDGVVLLMMREGEGVEVKDPWFTVLWRAEPLAELYRSRGLEPVWESGHVSDDGERWLTSLLRRTR